MFHKYEYGMKYGKYTNQERQGDNHMKYWMGIKKKKT